MAFDISSDREGWVEPKGSCGIGGDNYDWISELLGDKVGDTETDDSDDVVLVGGNDLDDDCVVLDGDPTKSVEIEN
ncbi:hypothetical protein U1Q18_032617, partial [Sarracenia purpurea var. burkii]